jgi:hypothetical protein
MDTLREVSYERTKKEKYKKYVIFLQEYYIVDTRGIGWAFSLLFKKNIPYEGLIYIYTKKEKLRILRKV